MQLSNRTTLNIIRKDKFSDDYFYFSDSITSGTYLKKILKREKIKKIRQILRVWRKYYIENKLSLVDHLEVERICKKREDYEPIDKGFFQNEDLLGKLEEKNIIKKDPINTNYYFFNDKIKKKKDIERLMCDDPKFSFNEKLSVLEIWRLFHNRSRMQQFIEGKVYDFLENITKTQENNTKTQENNTKTQENNTSA